MKRTSAQQKKKKTKKGTQKCNMHKIKKIDDGFHERTRHSNKNTYSMLCGLLRKRVWGVAQNHSQVQQPRVPGKNEKKNTR